MTLEHALIKIDELQHLIGKTIKEGSPPIELLMPAPKGHMETVFINLAKRGDFDYDEIALQLGISDFEIAILLEGSILHPDGSESGNIYLEWLIDYPELSQISNQS